MAEPLSKRLLFVTGKGGVGKSTVAAALGMLAARQGRRTIVAEVAGRDDVARALGDGASPGHAGERQLAERLWTISVDPQAAMEEYLADQLPLRAFADVLGSSRTFSYFAAATPGLRELLCVGKLWELAQPARRTPGASGYDLCVVDAPATGHGLALLRAPQTFAEVARVGPIARHARTISQTLTNSEVTGVIAVARAAEIPVTETLLLQRELRARLGIELDALIVNAVAPHRFAPREIEALTAASEDDRRADHASRHAALRAALGEHVRERGERAQLRRLRRSSGIAPIKLAALLGTASIGVTKCRALADELESQF
ncbi:MAG: ArsA family ATPase [Solirubrobacteraceae bacterium]|nr:MAG: chromosome partitioning protein [Solirubrobacterales bacterium]